MSSSESCSNLTETNLTASSFYFGLQPDHFFATKLLLKL